MASTRYIIVFEGESEWTYLQQLQSFLDKLPMPEGLFEIPVTFIAPQRACAKSGKYTSLVKNFKARRKESRKSSIKIWADFDLYHRNDNNNTTLYKRKTLGIPDFHFSFHNFEDFLALHLEDAQFNEWKRIFQQNGHFDNPLHAKDYLPEFAKVLPTYQKVDLPADFVSKASLKNLKRNKDNQPASNPQCLQEIRSFADFVVTQIDQAHPNLLI